MTQTDDIIDPTSVFDPAADDDDEDVVDKKKPDIKEEDYDPDSVENDDDVDKMGGNRYDITEELDVTKVPLRTPSDPPEKEPEI